MLSHVPGQSALLVTAVTHFLILTSGQNTAQGMGSRREFQRFRKIFQAEGEEDLFQILTALNIWLIGCSLHGTIT